MVRLTSGQTGGNKNSKLIKAPLQKRAERGEGEEKVDEVKSLEVEGTLVWSEPGSLNGRLVDLVGLLLSSS